jgi:hypothetical protein
MLPDGSYQMPVMPQGGGQQVPLPAGPQAGDPLDALAAQIGVPREQLEQMLGSTTVFPEQSGMLGGEMSMADRLRNTPMPDMRHAGRVSVAASPFEAAAATLQRVKGQKDYDSAHGEMQSLIDLLRQGRTTGAAMGGLDAGGY